MFTTLTAPAGRAARALGALAMALVLAALLTRTAAAAPPTGNQSVDALVAMLETSCQMFGGTVKVSHTYLENGSFYWTTVSCTGNQGS